MARILVTGAAGFIGTGLCPALAARGHDVVAGLRRPRQTPADTEPRVLGAIGPGTDWSAALRDIEVVIHLAQRAHAGPDAKTLAEEPEATATLAHAAAAAGAKRLVLLSSIKAMGETTEPHRPFRFDHEPRPVDAYGRAKLASETAASEAARGAGLELVIIRPPLVYGPGVKANFATLMRLAGSGLPLPFAAIDNCRSLIARDNLVDLIALAATHPAAAGQILLARDGFDLSTPQLIEALAAGLGKRARLFPVPNMLFSALRALPGIGLKMSSLTLSLQVDDSSTRTLMGWKFAVGVPFALAETARAFAKRL
ncbi:MAG TPA: NAD-dependent epimerase/dehydratase family protein [Stellaceae bacterium]|nr:NAD-dependent epimerase/dehydratase family protein [Stellaceae bacterium]